MAVSATMIRVLRILLPALLVPGPSVLLAQENPRITIIVDALSDRDDVRLDWGFAALVEYRGTRILPRTSSAHSPSSPPACATSAGTCPRR
ncbi:MAG: hypothetical protein FWJ74_11405 [Gemmatimonadota bacterium]